MRGIKEQIRHLQQIQYMNIGKPEKKIKTKLNNGKNS